MCRSPYCGVRAKTTHPRIARDSLLVRPSSAAVNSHRADGTTGQRGIAADNNSTAQGRPALEGGTDTESACEGYAAIAGQVLTSQFQSRASYAESQADVQSYLKPLCATAKSTSRCPRTLSELSIIENIAGHTARPLLRFAAVQFFKRVQHPTGLAPKGRFIATEAVEGIIGQIAEP